MKSSCARCGNIDSQWAGTVPDRKTDVKDSEWIAQLMQYGLLRGSFVPSPEVRQCKWRYLSAQYRRLAPRRGKNRAIVAVGHTILVAAYYILKDGVEYHDLGGDHFDQLRRERTVSHLVSRLQRLGYNVVLEAIEPDAA